MNKELFDVEDYILQYSGFTRVDRLIHIAQTSVDNKPVALMLALDILKKTNNAIMFEEIASKFRFDAKGIEYFDSNAWTTPPVDAFVVLENRLKLDLERAKAEIINEQIRMASIKLGDFYFEHGLYSKALAQYTKSRDYCANTAHNVTTYLKCAQASIGDFSFHNVHSACERIRELLGPKSSEAMTLSQVNALDGVASTCLGKFDRAATYFSQVNVRIGDSLNQTVTSKDIALYGTLCILAVFPREKIVTDEIYSSIRKIVSDLDFPLKNLIEDFLASRYDQCLKELELVGDLAKRDIYLYRRYDALFSLIRTKILHEYIIPFSTVDLVKMASSFNMSTVQLETELSNMIAEKKLSAKIDSQTMHLVVCYGNQSNNTHLKAIEAADFFCHHAENALLRMSMSTRERSSKEKPSSDVEYGSISVSNQQDCGEIATPSMEVDDGDN